MLNCETDAPPERDYAINSDQKDRWRTHTTTHSAERQRRGKKGERRERGGREPGEARERGALAVVSPAAPSRRRAFDAADHVLSHADFFI